MTTIHCHFCGGVIGDPTKIDYRPPRASAQFAEPGTEACACDTPIVYEHPPVIGPPDEDITP